MTCKDCIHYNACNKFSTRLGLPTTDMLGSENYCGCFTDKSRYIEVPEKVYQTDGVRVYESEVKGIIYRCDSIDFDARAIGQSVFLTREEAEERIEP